MRRSHCKLFDPTFRWPHAAPSKTWTMAELAAAYGLPANGPVGVPVWLAVHSLGGGYRMATIAAFAQRCGFPIKEIQDKSTPGSRGNRPGDPADVENYLDLMAQAWLFCLIARIPSQIYFISAPNNSSGPRASWKLADDLGVMADSSSWGMSEDQYPAADMQADNAVLKARKRPLFCAAGDNNFGDNDPSMIGGDGAHCDSPASDPFSIGVAGTSKTLTTEFLWNHGTNGGSGGGISDRWTRQPFQQQTATNGRPVADVAFLGDPQTGVLTPTDMGDQIIGGTSFGAPAWAGILGGLNSLRIAAGIQPFGMDFAPWLYAHQDCFTKITQGDNGKYPASLVAGLGVPRIDKLISAALAGTAPPIDTNPPTNPPAPEPVGSVTVFSKSGGILFSGKA